MAAIAEHFVKDTYKAYHSFIIFVMRKNTHYTA